MAGTDVACIDKRAYVHLSASAVDERDVSDREMVNWHEMAAAGAAARVLSVKLIWHRRVGYDHHAAFVNALQASDPHRSSQDMPHDCLTCSDILVLKLISVLVFILFSSQNFYFI